MWSATFKIHQKSSKTPQKTLPQPTFEKRRIQNASQNSFFGHLGRFLVNFWRPQGQRFEFWSDFGRFWEANLAPKLDFWDFFSRFLSTSISASIFGGFPKARNLKNSNFVSTGAQFSQNRRFRKSNEKSSILEAFSEAKTEKNREKMVLKNMCFFNIDFLALFCVFLRFWLDFGKPKIIKKLKKIQ